MAGESQQAPKTEPDPSVLTTQQLDKGLSSERDYVDGRIGILEQRLDGIDEATKVLHETVTRFPTEVQREVGHLREFILASLESERKLTQTQLDDAARALELALEATDKAMNKAEAASEKRFEAVNEFRKQLSDQATMFMPRTESIGRHDATTEKIADLTRAEARARDLLTERVTALALAQERFAAQGQTIFVLRSEALTTNKTTDDKITGVQKLVTESITELRALATDQNSKMMPRTESETRHQGTQERLRDLELRMQNFLSRTEVETTANALDEKTSSMIRANAQKIDELRQHGVLIDQQLLRKMDIDSNDKARFEALSRIDAQIKSVVETIDTKVSTVNDKVVAISARLDRQEGKGAGINALYGWIVAGIGLMISVIVLANMIFGSK